MVLALRRPGHIAMARADSPGHPMHAVKTRIDAPLHRMDRHTATCGDRCPDQFVGDAVPRPGRSRKARAIVVRAQILLPVAFHRHHLRRVRRAALGRLTTR